MAKNESSALEKPVLQDLIMSGKVDAKALIDNGFHTFEVYEVEALRYLYMARENQSSNDQIRVEASGNQTKNVVLLGDYDCEVNNQIAKVIDDAAKHLKKRLGYSCDPIPLLISN